VLFLCLNTEDPPQSKISDEQVSYVARTLEENRDARWTMVFMHKPFWAQKDAPEAWGKIEKLLEGRRHTVFGGHHHRYVKYRRNDEDYIKLATTGGGSQLAGPDLGEFDHVVWATMTDEGPSLALLPLDGVLADDVVTEEGVAMVGALRGSVASSDPFLIEGEVFDGVAVNEVRFQNKADLPMSIEAGFEAHKTLRAEPREMSLTVPPESTRTVKVELTAERATRTDDLAPLTLNLSARFEPKGRAALQRDQTLRIMPERLQDCPPRAEAPRIDGRLDEWDDLPWVCREPAYIEGDASQWTGPGDASFRFAVAHDEAFVYVAVETTDDRSVLNPNSDPWNQDAVAIHLDARSEPQRSQGRGIWRNRFKEFLVVEMCPGRESGETIIFEKEKAPEGMKAVCIKNGKGLTAEIAVPSSWLDAAQGEPWKAFRLNVGQCDSDQRPGQQQTLWWRPRWQSPTNFAGSGTFVGR
jgi:hypothetical protein